MRSARPRPRARLLAPRPRPLPAVAALAAIALAIALLGISSRAEAGPLGGFTGDERRYVAGSDSVCTPLPVSGGKATGTPSCTTTSAEELAHLAARAGIEQRGARATHAAAARGTVITISLRDGAAPIVTWDARDPVASVDGLTLSPRGAIAVVEYTVRLGGRAVPRLVGFAIGTAATSGSATSGNAGTGSARSSSAAGTGSGAGTGSAAGTAEPPTAAGGEQGRGDGSVAGPPHPGPAVAELDRSLAAARKQARKGGKKAVDAWRKVLALDASQPEAHYGLAVALLKQKKRPEALAELAAIAASQHPDAITWRVEARFDKAFAPLRSDPAFRKATGLDAPPATSYERLVGLGGNWQQAGTSCDVPEVSLRLGRLPRDFVLRIRSRCQGADDDARFDGTWSPTPTGVRLTFPNLDKAAEPLDCPLTACGGEDCLQCRVDDDLQFELRVVRR